MNTIDMPDDMRKRTADEMLELGEMLFDTIVEASALHMEGEAYVALIEEMKATADSFFTALRLLLDVQK